MTVGELINWLKDFDRDMEVRIGAYQSHGSDFGYEIDTIEEVGFTAFYDDEESGNCVCIIEGDERGTIGDKFEETDDELYPWGWDEVEE